MVIFYAKKNYEPYKILLVCFSITLIILGGNWGAVGLTYNPESFIFWFFTSLGFITISNYKNTASTPPSTI
jgi:hypothetical protein